ncbi:hypothetical protein [Burkholderia sp. BCC1047]|uniref:hypothetical protein n=1 Tax=Burkholderia sp. BCC1047 TaxID=2676299 RepID=UPI00158A1893|nr:hypothetical protein [Burkholderia sp. BCC1047]
MDIDRLLTVEERKDDGTGSLKTGQTRGVRCAGAGLRAINGTLRAAASIRFRTVRAGFAVHMARERDWMEALPRHPGARHGRRAAGGPPRDADAVGKLRPSEIMRQAPPAMHSSDERGGAADHPPRVSADSDSVAQFPDSDFSARRLATRRRHTILIT